MIRCVVLASGSGTKLQSLLDSIFFGEIPDMEIVAVISSDPEANALTRARNAHIEAVDIHREVFPNESTFDLAVRNKIRDLDADLVIDAGFHPGVGPETAKAFRNKIIAVQPSLVPAFQDLRGLAVHEAVGVVVLALQPQGLSHAVGVVEPLLVERLVDGRVVKGEHPHGNAPDLAVSVADEGAVVGIDGHQVALVDGIVGSGNGSREHPGMETLQGVFLAALESYGFIGHILVSGF